VSPHRGLAGAGQAGIARGVTACHDGDMEAVNLDAMLARFTEQWSPKRIARINDYDVRIVKVQGEFTWHRHSDTDEFFLVLGGQLTIQLRDGDRDRDVVLAPGELFVVPRGVEHCPRADVETAVLLLEPGQVVNTGDAGGDLTAEPEDLT
jgi:mannose-6-phosphate isomerase-like protein (cupin superfamily)